MYARFSRLRLLVGCLVLVLATAASDSVAQKSAPKKTPAPRETKPAGQAAAIAANTASSKRLDVTFISSRHVAAAVLHPQPLVKAPQMQAMPVEILEATLQEQAAIDLNQVQEFVLLFSVNIPPVPAAVVRFNTPCRQEAIIEALTVGEADKIGDRTTYRIKGRDPMFLVFANDHTLLVGTSTDLTEMLTEKDPASPLIDHLRVVDAAEPLSAVVVLDPIRPLLKNAVSQLPPLPPQYQQFTMLADLLAAIEVHLSSGDTMTPSLVLEGIGQGETARIDHLLDRAVEFAAAAMDHRVAQIAAEEPGPVGEATGRYMKRMLKMTLDAIQRQQTQNRLTLSLHPDSDLSPNLATNGVLIAMLLPAVQSARGAARRAQSTNNLKQIGIAMHNHHDVFGTFPPRARFKNGKPLLSWRVTILPFVEQQALYNEFHLDEPWDSEHNRKLIEKMPPMYANPKLDPKLLQAGKTNYLVPTGPNALFDGEKGPAFQNIPDGTANTVMVLEANADRAVIWTAPDDLEIDPDNPRDGLGAFQPGLIMTLFADGSVHQLPAALDAETLSNLFNPRDGKVVRLPPP